MAEQSIDAFLLTRQWFDSAKGILLDFWFSSAAGPVHVLIEQQQAIFFIREEDSQQVNRLLTGISNTTIKPLKLKDFDHKPAAGVYFHSQQSLYRARERLQQSGIRHYEADIRPTERYLMERYLTGPVTIRAANKQPDNDLLINPQIKAQSHQEAIQASLKVMSLDIETAYDSNELYSISMLCEHWHITLLKGKTIASEQAIEFFADERQLMLRFIDLISEQDPDIFIGWNVINFDFRFLQRKANQLKMSLTIGRNESLPVWRKAHTEQNHFFLLIPGRVILDGIDTLKSATWNFPSFSLEAVGNELLGRGKLIKDQNDNKKHDPLKKAKEIKRLFYQEKLALAAYNLEDCQLVWDIFEHTDLMSFAIERARLTGLEMDRIGGSVAAFDNLYLPRLHRKGFVAPDINDHRESLSAPGGYVMNSKPGLYDSVLVLDYKSLYPSIICTYKVDPYAAIKAQTLNKAETIPGFNNISFARNDSILPEIIHSLWNARDQAKQANNSALSQAIKIIMNSFYGVLGTSGCRVHDARLTSSITLRGHELMKQTIQLIEAQGYQVIYGDTDSVFVSLGNAAKASEADKTGHYLAQEINNYWHKQLKKDYQIESFLEMEYETHYQRFFMPTIRGSDKGSKKRYAGLIAGTDRIIFKGLETVRTDWTSLAREVQQELFYRIFNDRPYIEYLKGIVADLRLGKVDDKLIYRKRLRQELSAYTKNRPPHAQAALKAETYAKDNNIAQRYDKGSWIEYVMTLSGPEPLYYNTRPLDYEHYINKQIAPAVDALLLVVNTSLEKIIQAQYELF